jgi:hypothetical protein
MLAGVGNKDLVTLHVRLLDEGVEVWRPVSAYAMGGDLYRLVGDKPDGEVWEFPPGAIVLGRRQALSEGTVLVATAPPSSDIERR